LDRESVATGIFLSDLFNENPMIPMNFNDIDINSLMSKLSDINKSHIAEHVKNPRVRCIAISKLKEQNSEVLMKIISLNDDKDVYSSAISRLIELSDIPALKSFIEKNDNKDVCKAAAERIFDLGIMSDWKWVISYTDDTDILSLMIKHISQKEDSFKWVSFLIDTTKAKPDIKIDNENIVNAFIKNVESSFDLIEVIQNIEDPDVCSKAISRLISLIEVGKTPSRLKYIILNFDNPDVCSKALTRLLVS
jgi:HEAT repeat protein